MEGQFEHDLYKTSFSNQLESDEIDTLQQRIDWWMLVFDKGGPIPNDVYDFSFGELFALYRNAVDREMRDLVSILGDRQIIPGKKININVSGNN